MAVNKTIDRTTKYELMDYWLKNMTPSYMDTRALSLSNVGFFGYMNAVMADTFEAHTNETSVLYNEIFPKKAQLTESILSYAAQYGLEDINATPAVMDFSIAIREDILLNSLIQEDDEAYFIIDKDSEIYVEDEMQFMLDYDVKINVKYREGKPLYSAMYKLGERDRPETVVLNPLSEITDKTNPYLRIVRMRQEDGQYYVYVFVKARQVHKTIISKLIYQDEFIDYYTFDFDYEGMLADFYVLYREPNGTRYIQLEKRIIDSAPSEKPFCWYQYRDDDTISISFSTMIRHFRPAFNSELVFVVFTTKGEKGNFTYSGNNVRIVPKSEIHDYRRVIMFAQDLSESTGGYDKMTFPQIKEKTSFLATTGYNIATAIDLNNYFQSVEKGSSRFLFLKKRDDILDRLFSAFVLFRDRNKNIMPTNTLNLKIKEDQYDLYEESTKRYTLKAGTTFVYDGDKRQVRIEKDPAKLKNERFVYKNPFTIVMSKVPYSVTYYLNSMDKVYQTNFKYINESALYNFIINNVRIQRDAINGEDSYKFSFKMMPNADIKPEFIANWDIKDPNKFLGPTGNIVVKGVLMDDKEEIQYYMDFNLVRYDRSHSELFFEGSIKTDDYISAVNYMRTKDSIYRAWETTKQPNILIEASKIKLGLVVYCKEDDPKYYKGVDQIPGMTNFSVTNIFKVQEDIDLINNMSDIMRSHLEVVPENPEDYLDPTKNGYYYIIKEVPYVRSDYISIKEYTFDFVNQALDIAYLLRRETRRLTNNFSIDYKLYNTFGKSYYFYIKANPELKVDRVNIDFYIWVKLNPNKMMDEILKTNIKNYIKEYIESINDTENFHVSNLLRKLENDFKDVTYTEFQHINEYLPDVQTIEKQFPLNSVDHPELVRNFVPEYLCVDKVYHNSVQVTDNVVIKYI